MIQFRAATEVQGPWLGSWGGRWVLRLDWMLRKWASVPALQRLPCPHHWTPVLQGQACPPPHLAALRTPGVDLLDCV